MNSNNNVTKMVTGGLLAAAVFAATCISFPNGIGGYMHLGDAVVIMSVMFLGGRRGALSAAIGAMLADIILGYAMWAPISLLAKASMALIIGGILGKMSLLKGRQRWFAAVLAGVAAETLIYGAAGFILEGGIGGAVAEVTGMAVQGGIALIAGFMLTEALQKSPLRKAFFYTTEDHKKINADA